MAAGAQPQGEADNSLAAIWITLLLFITIAIIWYLYKSYIAEFVLIIKYWEAKAIIFILPENWTISLKAAIENIEAFQNSGFANIKPKDLYRVSDEIGQFTRYPIIAMLIAMALYLYFKSPLLHYKKLYSMKSLLNQEKHNWPQVTPISKLDLVNDDIKKGPWAMSVQPMEFAKKHNLLVLERVMQGESSLLSNSIITASINRDDARKVFAMQMGPYWQDIEQLPIYIQALFGVFASRLVGERDKAHKLLLQIAGSVDKGKLDFTGAQDLVKKYKDHKLVTKIIRQHAFVLTAMASLLEGGRQDGVIATADFLWLKPVDRRLWYMLNSVGRQTPFAEVAGPFAHWLVEKELQRRLNLPMIEEAVNGLEAGVKEFIYKPDEES